MHLKNASESLTKLCQLAYPAVNAQLHLICDASNRAIGSSVNQFDSESRT